MLRSRRARAGCTGRSASIADGAHWCDALQRARLVTRAQAAVFKSAERAGNLAWALEEMADSSVRRAVLPRQAALNVLFPALILVCGIGVMFVAVGMLLPLFDLISNIDMNATALHKRRRRRGLSMTEMVVTVAITTVAMVGAVRSCRWPTAKARHGGEPSPGLPGSGQHHGTGHDAALGENRPRRMNAAFELSEACRQTLPDAKLHVRS